MFTFGSLFSGIGGLDLGLERAGWRVLWQVEADDYRRSILERHWPEVKRYGRIESVDFGQLPCPDLLVGGFPCQPVSSAGKRLAQDDPRWLWPHFARAIRVLRPRFVLVENVTGLLSRGFGDVLRDLAASGYDAEWTVLPAALAGAPHPRERVWIVAYSNSCSRARGNYVEAIEGVVFIRRHIIAAGPSHRTADHWATEPDVGRMVDGFSGGMGRIVEALGDAVVPQAAEFVGRLLLQAAVRVSFA